MILNEDTAKEFKGKIGYLACAYSSKLNDRVAAKEQEVNRAINITNKFMELMKLGVFTYSPITSSHYAHEVAKDSGGDWETWRDIDLAFVDRCDYVLVYETPEVIYSTGCIAEIKHAIAEGKEILFLHPNKLEISSRPFTLTVSHCMDLIIPELKHRRIYQEIV